MLKKKSVIIIAIFTILFFYKAAFTLETSTHRAINLRIANSAMNGFSLDQYLKSNLGMSQGIEEIFNKLRVDFWLRDGGLYEDNPPWTIPYLRSVNHFHNPITKRGYSGIWGTGILSGESSLLWAQKPKETQWPGGYYSWHDVRDYFYNALTSSDKITRDAYFAQTFRGLGQLMHLVQDLSVPAHTRDEGHLFYNYENWVEGHPEIIAASTPVFFDLNVLGQPNPLASVPIANLFDTNKYNGTNPEITISKNIGLSEYTNANFTSDDTIFNNFPYPKYSSGSYEMYEIDIPPDKKRIYLKKKGDGESIEHFATAGPFYKYLSFDPVLQKNELKLDPAVYKDYASLLIPRAVGYSAGLLDYFFRGKMEATNVAMIEDSGGNINGAKLKVKNLTSNEAMGPGELIVSYQYKPAGSNDFVYGTSNKIKLNKPLAFGSESTNEFKFHFKNAVLSDAQETKFLLVFRGKLGNEEDAVVGRMFEFNKLNKFFGNLFNFGDTDLYANLVIKHNHNTLMAYGNYTSNEDGKDYRISTTFPFNDDKYIYRAVFYYPSYSMGFLRSNITDLSKDEGIVMLDIKMFQDFYGYNPVATVDDKYFYVLISKNNSPNYVRKYDKATGGLIAEQYIGAIWAGSITCDNDYLYIEQWGRESSFQTLVTIRRKSDLSLVLSLPPVSSVLSGLKLDDKYFYQMAEYPEGSYWQPSLNVFEKTSGHFIKSIYLPDILGIRQGYSDKGYFDIGESFALDETSFYFMAYNYSTGERYFYRVNKESLILEISYKEMGYGLSILSNSYEYFVAAGLDKKGYKFEYGTEE